MNKEEDKAFSIVYNKCAFNEMGKINIMEELSNIKRKNNNYFIADKNFAKDLGKNIKDILKGLVEQKMR